MSQKLYRIFINHTFFEKRIAFCTHEKVEEVWIDRGDPEKNIVGNIYLGRIHRVLPGMQAAFVDIGIEKNGFLYEGDVIESEEEDLDYWEGDTSEPLPNVPAVPSFQSLRPSDTILVQITKGPIASKGARVTTSLTITGKFLVLTPQNRRIGVSKKIRTGKDREELFGAIREVQKKHSVPYGIIIRTAAMNISNKKLQEEYLRLVSTWHTIVKACKRAKAPILLYSDNNPLDRMFREYCGHSNTQIIVDSPSVYHNLLTKAQERYFFPPENILLYAKGGPLFEDFGIEPELTKALDRRVWLKSGGYLVFDETEALTVIDVNTGRYVGKSRLEDTLIQINLEAAEAVVHQIILRNLSGIIVVDFIDMDEPKHRQQISDTLKLLLREDKTRNSVLSMTQLGLIQITRKRTHPSLLHQLSTPCSYCDGKGRIKSRETVLLEILRSIHAKHRMRKTKKRFIVCISEPLFTTIQTTHRAFVKAIESQESIRVSWRKEPRFHQEEYEIS